MEIINQLLNIDPNYILIGLITVFFLMEMAVIRPFNFKGKFKHLFHSSLFRIVGIFLGSLLGFMFVTTFDYISTNNFGLLNLFSIPLGIKIIVGFFIIDFADYWLHRFDHKIPILWRFHRVHHSDTSMDALTALRAYPTAGVYFTIGELFISLIFGIDIMSMNIFLLILIPLQFIHHTNIQYPIWVDKTLGWLIVMPNHHKVHHEQDQFYTDSNYGTIFIIWDRLLGTFKTKPVNEIKYGLIEFEGSKKQSFLYLMKSPFINIHRLKDKN
mgnify:CR=1 FL=1